MAQRKPKKISRQVRPTALIYCEGAHELAFLRLLKKYYSNNSKSGAHFSVKKGAGGAPISLIEDSLRVPGDFNRRLVKMDFDRPKAEYKLAENYATKEGVVIIKTKPCLDALLLSILDKSVNYAKLSSSQCKRQFETKYIASDKRKNISVYEKIFTKSILREARKRISELDKLIGFFEI